MHQIHVQLALQSIRTPPVSHFVKKAIGAKSGSQRPGHASAGTISLQHVYEIASVKALDRPDLTMQVHRLSWYGIAMP